MSVMGLIEFPSSSDLAGRIQPVSQLSYLSSVTSMHTVVPPTPLRQQGWGLVSTGPLVPSCCLH